LSVYEEHLYQELKTTTTYVLNNDGSIHSQNSQTRTDSFQILNDEQAGRTWAPGEGPAVVSVNGRDAVLVSTSWQEQYSEDIGGTMQVITDATQSVQFFNFNSAWQHEDGSWRSDQSQTVSVAVVNYEYDASGALIGATGWMNSAAYAVYDDQGTGQTFTDARGVLIRPGDRYLISQTQREDIYSIVDGQARKDQEIENTIFYGVDPTWTQEPLPAEVEGSVTPGYGINFTVTQSTKTTTYEYQTKEKDGKVIQTTDLVGATATTRTTTYSYSTDSGVRDGSQLLPPDVLATEFPNRVDITTSTVYTEMKVIAGKLLTTLTVSEQVDPGREEHNRRCGRAC